MVIFDLYIYFTQVKKMMKIFASGNDNLALPDRRDFEFETGKIPGDPQCKRCRPCSIPVSGVHVQFRSLDLRSSGLSHYYG